MGVQIKCPTCHKLFNVPSEVLGQDGPSVIVRMDRTALVNHDCGTPAPPPPAPVRGKAMLPANPHLAGRIGLLLEREGYVAQGGSRACTMCGTKGAECLEGLRGPGPRPPCCAACGVGNTHPAPGESVGSCAQYAAEKIGPVQ